MAGKNKCETCNHWLQISDGPVNSQGRINGQCRRYAPRPSPGASFEWPVVGHWSWCGEHSDGQHNGIDQ